MILAFYDIAILSACPQKFVDPNAGRGVSIRAVESACAAVRTLRSLGHDTAEERVIQRFQNGLSFIEVHQSGHLVGSAWIVSAPSRYIDEAALSFPLSVNEIWLRDVFVSPGYRGRGIFSGLISQLRIFNESDIRCIWSDVDVSNAASMKAHEKSGFARVGRIRTLVMFDSLIVRLSKVEKYGLLGGIRPDKRIVLLLGEARQKHLRWIA